MLPVPFIDYIPQSYTRDSKLTAFADKHDSIINGISEDILGLNHLMNPLRIPAGLIEHLGFFLNAGLLPFDSESIKRSKVAKAVQSHKRRGSFNLDAKPKIDDLAGGDSQLIKSVGGDDWILAGDGETPSAFYWSALGVDGVDTDLGIALVGGGDEIEIAGNIFIDVDNSSLSSDEQEQLRVTMLDIVPAYYKVHFGYLSAGAFVEYFVMG